MLRKVLILLTCLMLIMVVGERECCGDRINEKNGPAAYRIKIGGKYYTLISLLTQKDVIRLGMPNQAVIGQLINDQYEISPDNFVQNKKFVDFFHKFIQSNAPRDAELRSIAKKEGDGFVWVIDARSDQNDINHVAMEDIIGLFVVKNGKIVKDSYTRFGSHRLLTTKGFFRLKPRLQSKLVKKLRKLPPVKSGG